MGHLDIRHPRHGQTASNPGRTHPLHRRSPMVFVPGPPLPSHRHQHRQPLNPTYSRILGQPGRKEADSGETEAGATGNRSRHRGADSRRATHSQPSTRQNARTQRKTRQAHRRHPRRETNSGHRARHRHTGRRPGARKRRHYHRDERSHFSSPRPTFRTRGPCGERRDRQPWRRSPAHPPNRTRAAGQHGTHPNAGRTCARG